MKPKHFDFSGWATRNDIKCADGRTIRRDAFKDCDGLSVPLVWSHQHDSPEFVLGHAMLENRPEGVYCYGTFNDTELAQKAKNQVCNKDITSLSIYANHLQQDEARNVLHGAIREVSLVLAGANPGAYIDYSMAHSDEESDSVAATIFNPIEDLLVHSDEDEEQNQNQNNLKENEMENTELNHADDKTVQEVLDTFNEEQKTVLMYLVGQALEDNKNNNNSEEDNNMAHNVFENDNNTEEVLSHSDMSTIFSNAKRGGSLKQAVAEFLSDDELAHGVTNIGYLYPDHKNVTDKPLFIARDMGWVDVVMNGVHHTPFSRIKSVFANVTADEARAKGYLTKGSQKIEETIAMLKRTTDPTTVYKLQKFDRDDILDITDFDVVAWIKTEMRMMLNEEIARAILISDGRSAVAADKIAEDKIRPIWTDDDLYTIKSTYSYEVGDTDAAKVKKFIKACLVARKSYKGSGNPVLFTTEDVLTECLLLEDLNGRVIYDTQEKLATALRVSKIVTVPVMESKTRTVGDDTHTLMGIIVNMADYNVGADKGAAVTMFDDFDIDYNKYEYLIETRISGALTKPYSAIAVELVEAGEEANA